MKKWIALFLCLALCLSLAACKSKEAKAAEEAIAAIGSVNPTLELGAWLDLMVEEGVYAEYSHVPVMDMYEILQLAGY